MTKYRVCFNSKHGRGNYFPETYQVEAEAPANAAIDVLNTTKEDVRTFGQVITIPIGEEDEFHGPHVFDVINHNEQSLFPQDDRKWHIRPHNFNARSQKITTWPPK